MQNNMENLVGKKLKCIRGSDYTTKGKIYLINDTIERNFYIKEDDNENRLWDINNIGVYFELTSEDYLPNKGDKVLYTDDLEFWHEGIFLTKYNDSYIIDSDEMLLYAIDIKPYVDEIKVGDWVKDGQSIIKITLSNLCFYDNWNENVVKITKPELIKLLNEEL